jgi:sporulation protein YlmC with PRC-barrel domain
MEPIDNLASLQGMPVVAFDEGLRLGRVRDVFIDKRAKRIQGVSLRSGLRLKEKDAYVELTDILKIGHDVIIVKGRDAVRPLDDDMIPNSLRHLKGFKITTRDGAWIGEVADLNVNRENGTISEMILKDDTLMEVDAEDIALGPDVVVVPSAYLDRITRPENARRGLLGRVFGPANVTDSLREKYEEIKDLVSGGRGADKMLETLRSGSEKTRETVWRTSRRIQETLDQMRRKRGREEGDIAAEDSGYQGAEAEHAGRTHAAADPRGAGAAPHAGPFTEEEGRPDRPSPTDGRPD